MSGDKIDVLAVLNDTLRWITTTGNEGLYKTVDAEMSVMRLRKARAAVAELIATAKETEARLRNLGRGKSAVERDNRIMADSLRDALARVTGDSSNG